MSLCVFSVERTNPSVTSVKTRMDRGEWGQLAYGGWWEGEKLGKTSQKRRHLN